MNPALTPAGRPVERLVRGIDTADGAGVRLTRVLTADLQVRLDPFLMLDSFRSDDPQDYLGGFPDHPHRGFETLTYMLAGQFRHRDSAGHEGLLGPGGAQWMTAGSGLIHSELPEQENGRMEGFQFWINLPARDKMTPPAYRDFPSASIPEWTGTAGEQVRILAGRYADQAGAVQRPVTAPLILDIHLPAGCSLTVPFPATHNGFVYPYRGHVHIAGHAVPERHMAILANDGQDRVCLEARDPTRLILAAGAPLKEPIVQHGPFVMNTTEEIETAIRDYRNGRFNQATVDVLAA